MSLSQTDPNKRKHPKKFYTKTIAPKSRQAKLTGKRFFLVESNF